MKNITKIRLVALGLLLALTTTTIGPLFAADTPFTDVPANHWAYNQINQAVEGGIVGGYQDGTFKPGNPVSYGAFSLMLARAFYPNELSGTGVAAGEAVMEKHGITENTARQRGAAASQPMSREDMALYMFNLLEDTGTPIPTSDEYNQSKASMNDFFDINPYNRRGVLVCYTLGLLTGQKDGGFGPKNSMNRAQACVVIARLQACVQDGGYTPPAQTNPSTPSTPETPTTPTTPSTAPEVTDGPLFQILEGETAQQMMDRINDASKYTPGYLSNGKPITEENIKELLAKFEETMPIGSPWYDLSISGNQHVYNSPKFGAGGGCNSFAAAISDALFCEEAPMTRHQNFDQLKVGDVVWVKNSNTGFSHVFVVTSLTSKWGPGRYSACDAGGSRGVDWDHEDGSSEFSTFDDPAVAPNTYVYSRYGTGAGTDVGW